MADQQIAKMLNFISQCNEPGKLRTIAANASVKGVDEVSRAAKLKLYEILPAERPKTLEHEVWRAIHALEDALTDERGRTTRLSRTRQKIGRQGEVQCVADLVTGKPADGFRMLAERNMLHLSFEAVALRYPERFDKEALDAAQQRLADAGYSFDR